MKLEVTGFVEATLCWWSRGGQKTVFSFADPDSPTALVYRQQYPSPDYFMVNGQNTYVELHSFSLFYFSCQFPLLVITHGILNSIDIVSYANREIDSGHLFAGSDVWNHFCVKWRSSDGKYDVHINGKLCKNEFQQPGKL